MTTSSESSGARLRVVVDTSVFIAAILRPSLSEDVLRRIYQGKADLYCSREIFAELQAKLATKPFQVDPKRAAEALATIRKLGIFVDAAKIGKTDLRDPDDVHVLACAVAAEANLIITQDQDLISLKEYEGIRIIHPKTFRWMTTLK